jgi:hypothetical protein
MPDESAREAEEKNMDVRRGDSNMSFPACMVPIVRVLGAMDGARDTGADAMVCGWWVLWVEQLENVLVGSG